MPICDHCLLDVPEPDAVYADIDGKRKVFCCHGCSGVYRLIHSEGLDAFYEKRTDWTPGPAAAQPLDVAAFLSNLRPEGDTIETDIILDGIRCASCVWLNEKILLRTPGVVSARVNYATHRARISWDPSRIEIRTILSRIVSLGYTPKPFFPQAYADAQKRETRDLLVRFGTAAFFSMQLMLYSIALYAGYFQGIDEKTKLIFHLISLGLTTPVVFYAGWPLIKGSLRGIRNLTFNMDVLIVVGALSAYGYSIQQTVAGGEVYFDTAAMIITLILLGRLIEAGAKRKASETINRLMQLNPVEARSLVGGQSAAHEDGLHRAERRMVPISSVRVDDLIEVLPGERVPVDGVVVSGSTEIDESMLTGESKPCAKSNGAEVSGGTMNLYGSFILRVERIGKDTVLAQIIRTVEDAQARRAPIQAFADRVVAVFVPLVMVIAVCTFLGWFLSGAAAAKAVMNAVSVLVIACPCALGLATPLAILIGTSNGAAQGIMIKGGDVIEKARRIDTVLLDKTGTITEGRPVLRAHFGIGLTDHEALLLAMSLERKSEHSLGKAIADAAKNNEALEVAAFAAVPGKGVRGTVRNKAILLGSREFIETEGIMQSMDQALGESLGMKVRSLGETGATLVYLSYDGVLAGVFAIADKIRHEAAQAVSRLKDQGFTVAMITGDDQRTANAIAREAGIESVSAQAGPMEKARQVRLLKQQGRNVAMAGDGINDAPALVEASVGIAVGRATDIALESSDIVLMRPDLGLVGDALALTRKTFSIIRQNIFWAFFYNVVVLPLAALGFLHPIVAAGAMAFSSLSVVGNSLRARIS